MTDCIFCKMIAGEIKADIVYEDEKILAFRDIRPQAPLHILIIPKRHITNLNNLDDINLGGQLLHITSKLAEDLGYAESGFRTIINTNQDGGQTVYHLHIHLLAGRPLNWPPG